MSKENISKIAEKSERERSLELLCSDCYKFYSNTSCENAGQLLCKDCIAKLIAANRKAADKYIKAGTVPMLIFVFIWGMIKAFVNFFIVGAKAGGNLARGSYVGFGDAVVAFFKMVIFPITAGMDVSASLRKKKESEAIVASDSQTQQEMQNGEKLTQAELCQRVDQIFANSETLMGFVKKKK